MVTKNLVFFVNLLDIDVNPEIMILSFWLQINPPSRPHVNPPWPTIWTSSASFNGACLAPKQAERLDPFFARK